MQTCTRTHAHAHIVIQIRTYSHTHTHMDSRTHAHIPVPSEAYMMFSNLLSSVKTEMGFDVNVGFLVTTNVWCHAWLGVCVCVCVRACEEDRGDQN